MLAKLDSALLFFSSSLSLAFGVGYAYLGATLLQYFLPMLFLGWVMPVYIGYVRGALTKDLLEERVRGWIYFIMGLGFYAFSPIVMSSFGRFLNLGLYFSVLIVVPSLVFGYILGKGQAVIVYDLFKLRKQDISPEVKKAFTETRLSALTLAASLSVISTVNWSEFYRKPDLLLRTLETVMIFLLAIILAIAVISEKKARKLLEKPENKQKKK